MMTSPNEKALGGTRHPSFHPLVIIGWVLGAAISFVVLNIVPDSVHFGDIESGGPELAVAWGLKLLKALTIGVAIGSLLLLLIWRLSGFSGSVEPGARLLTVYGIIAVAQLTTTAAAWQLSVTGIVWEFLSFRVARHNGWLVAEVVVSLIASVTFIAAVLRMKGQSVWRKFFICAAVFSMIRLVNNLAFASDHGAGRSWGDVFEWSLIAVVIRVAEGITLTAVVVAAIKSDGSQFQSRHWLHWTGIVVFASYIWIGLLGRVALILV